MSIFLKTEDEIDLMCEAKQLAGTKCAEVGKHIQEGGYGSLLDCLAHTIIRGHGVAQSIF
ncbi:hypothetical protein HMPREF2140_07245 [Hoylesella buccalis DNF00985]|nr:hypothetical protein HMPREF2140_07245 [Hoylesella buccalis DNF00985]